MTDDPIPAHVREVLALFADELREVRFGELDAASLEALAERTREAALEVERAREALDAAHAALAAAREALSSHAAQALAYAKVFAAGDAALAARLAVLERPEPPARKTRKRKEPREAAVTELPFEHRGAA